MSKRKTILKTVSVILSLLILLTVMPLGVSATDTSEVTPEAVTEDVTIQDVIAGAASLEDLPYEYETLKVPEEQQWISVKPSDDESVQAEADYSLNTTIVDNGDGTHTMTLYDYPVKYVNSDGEVEDISLEIASASDGSYRTKANDIQTVFPKKISDGISLSGKGVSIKLKPSVPTASSGNISATANATQITSDSTVTKLDSETVSYYYDSRTTLEYSLTYTGFKEDIVVSEYTGQTEYTFLLETGGLTLTKIDESYYLTDENGEVKATLGDIIIFTADERNNNMGSMTHVTVRENHQYLITIHVDADYLKDENTAYPIRIDPTIEITYDNNGAGAIQDVTLNELSGSSGSSGSMYVGKRGTYGISRTLMKFPGLNLSAIPSNSTINSAYIEIRDLMCETTAMNVNACMFLGDDWDESTANWTDTNSNLYYSLNGGSVSVSYSNGDALDPKHRYSLNITRAVKLWRSGLYDDSKGIMLKADSSVENGSSSLYKTFASYNRASNKPSLVINYTSNVTHTAYGWLGFVNSSVINGWVWCSNHPSEALDIVLTITNTTTNQAWRTAGIANVYRSDVEEAGFGTGNYGFSLGMGDWTAFPPGTYSVSAVAVLPSGSTYTLHASPKTYINDVIHLSYPDGCGNYLLVGNRMTMQYNYSGGTHTIVWTSSDTSIANVNEETGLVTARTVGSALITATLTNSSTGEVRESSKVVYVRENVGIVNNEAYYIMNYESSQYLSVSGTSVCVANRTETNSNKWTLSIQNDGKYNLLNGVSSANNVLNASGTSLVISSNSSADNSIGTEDFTVYRVINEGPEGLYYIRYNNYYVTQGSNDITLTSEPTDSSYWSFMKVNKGNVYFAYTRTVTTDDEGNQNEFDLSTHKTLILDKLSEMGYTSATNQQNPEASSAHSYLTSSSAFISYVHSNPGLIMFSNLDDTPKGYIAVNTKVLTDSDTTYYIDESVLQKGVADNGLANLNFVFYIGCSSGADFIYTNPAGGESVYNMVDATYNKGAHFVLGCTKIIYKGQGDLFLEKLFTSIVDNETNIQQYIEFAQMEAGWMQFPDGSQGYFPLYYVGDGNQMFYN